MGGRKNRCSLLKWGGNKIGSSGIRIEAVNSRIEESRRVTGFSRFCRGGVPASVEYVVDKEMLALLYKGKGRQGGWLATQEGVGRRMENGKG